MFGAGETYKQAESGLKNVDDYYKYKKMESEGKLTHKRSKERYEMLKGRIERGMKDIEFDSQGRAYFSGSHRSAAKGLGGVNDQYMVDMDGNVMHFINDENDLFGIAVPGDKRVISVTPPTVYNIWDVKGKSAPDLKGKAHKEMVTQRTADKYGAASGGTSRDALRRQAGEAALNYNPTPELQDYATPAGTVAGAGLLSTSIAQQDEDN